MIYECPIRDACVNGTCVEGTFGPRCSLCEVMMVMMMIIIIIIIIIMMMMVVLVGGGGGTYDCDTGHEMSRVAITVIIMRITTMMTRRR
jgi:hypothetical protein